MPPGGRQAQHGLLLAWLGSAARREGDYAGATALLQDSMAIAHDLWDKWTIGLALGHLGIIARLQGDADRATALHAESLALSKEMGYASHIAFNLGSYVKMRSNKTTMRGRGATVSRVLS